MSDSEEIFFEIDNADKFGPGETAASRLKDGSKNGEKEDRRPDSEERIRKTGRRRGTIMCEERTEPGERTERGVTIDQTKRYQQRWRRGGGQRRDKRRTRKNRRDVNRDIVISGRVEIGCGKADGKAIGEKIQKFTVCRMLPMREAGARMAKL